LIQTNKPGIPDLVLMKPDQIRFVEVKSASGRLSKIQEYRHDQLRWLGLMSPWTGIKLRRKQNR
jgi:hypothetical protein